MPRRRATRGPAPRGARRPCGQPTDAPGSRHPSLRCLSLVRSADAATCSARIAAPRRRSPPVCPHTLNQARVMAPFFPSASANPVSGIRQRHRGLPARPIHIGLARSAMLLAGFGLAVGAMLLSRSRKPQVMDCMTRALVRSTRMGRNSRDLQSLRSQLALQIVTKSSQSPRAYRVRLLHKGDAL